MQKNNLHAGKAESWLNKLAFVFHQEKLEQFFFSPPPFLHSMKHLFLCCRVGKKVATWKCGLHSSWASPTGWQGLNNSETQSWETGQRRNGWTCSLEASGLQRLPVAGGFRSPEVSGRRRLPVSRYRNATVNHSERRCGLKLSVNGF